MIKLVMKAQVRESITISPPNLILNQAGREDGLEGTLEVENYSDRDFRSLSLSTSSNWLRASQARRSVKGPGLPRQAWHVKVRAETGSLSPGRYREQLLIGADGSDVAPTKVAVHLEVDPAIEVAPLEMDFGVAKVGQPITRSIFLASNTGKLLDQADIRLSYDLTDRFSAEIVAYSSRRWMIKGILTPRQNDRSIGGMLVIKLRGRSPNEFRIPVKGSVNQ